MHMVEFIQLYTNEPHVWLEHGCHPSSSVIIRVPTICMVGHNLKFSEFLMKFTK